MKFTPITNHFICILKLEHFDPSLKYVESRANQIVEELHLNVVNKSSHMFPVHGITLAYILSQSHLVIHTWPEDKVLHIDMATCDTSLKLNVEDMEKMLKRVFIEDGVEEIEVKEIVYSMQ